MTSQEATAIIIGIVMGLGAIALVTYLSMLILQGKGDGLISGYDTLSDEKKARYDIIRLRKLAGWFGLAIAGYCLVIAACTRLWKSPTLTVILLSIAVMLAVAYIWLVNTWAKKK